MDLDITKICETETLDNGNLIINVNHDAEIITTSPPQRRVSSENPFSVIVHFSKPGSSAKPRIVKFNFRKRETKCPDREIV